MALVFFVHMETSNGASVKMNNYSYSQILYGYTSGSYTTVQTPPRTYNTIKSLLSITTLLRDSLFP